MKKHLFVSKYYIVAFLFIIASTLKAQTVALTSDFESNTIGDSLSHMGWYPADIQSVVADDPVASGNKVLKNTVHNYNAAPVLMFVLPEGKTLSDYDSLSFKGYFEQGDVGYKSIIVEAYQTMPTGPFNNNADALIGSWSRSKGGSTDWEDISVDITNTMSLSDTVYIAFGISCAGTGDVGAPGDTTIWYADDVTLVAKTSTAPAGLSQNFESNTIGDSLSHMGWYPADIQSVVADDPVTGGNNVLKNTVHNYNAAPVLMFVLPEGKTLANYDSLTFKGYFAQGDVGYKSVMVEAYQTMPTGPFNNNADAQIGSVSRSKGGSTDWEDISVDITNTMSLSDTVYIAFGISCAGTGDVGAPGDTTIWYADDVTLVAKTDTTSTTPTTPSTPQEIVTNGDFEESDVDTVSNADVKGWLIQVADGISPAPVFEIVSDSVQHGNRALKVSAGAVGSNQWDIQIVADSLHVTPGKVYQYSIWAKSEKAGAQVNFTVGNYSYSEYGVIRPATLTTQWKKYSIQFKVSDNQTVIRAPIHFGYSANVNNPIYIDNLQIMDVDEPKKPVIVEAESGNIGSNFSVMQDGDIKYVNEKTTYAGLTSPGDTSRMITYQVTFADSGYYNLFARVRVGSGGFNDDSFFYGKGFGEKNDTASADWVFINGLGSAGFSDSAAVVNGPGTLGSGVWKWVNVTKNSYQGTPGDSFHVSMDNLVQTFQIGSREDGLDIDKFAFGKTNLFYTVNSLNNRLPGTITNPEADSSLFWTGPPIAEGQAKFIGNAYGDIDDNVFANYWNQLTPGNAGKFGSVATSEDTTKWNWAPLDKMYKYALDHKLIFKYHNLIWGQQQPSWISSLDSAQQASYLETWIRMVGQRYPKTDMVDVVNEPLVGHNPPDGTNGNANYKKALGGNGATGWDWVIKSFELARKYLPNAKLLVNDFNIINDNSATTAYLQLINLLKDRELIDGIGVQAHRFSLENTDTNTIKNNLNRLAATGLPVYVSELDLGNIGDTGTPNDDQQLQLYKKIFPILWKNPGVKGITLWGYLEGQMWQTTCYLVHFNGESRPAFSWLVQYIKDNPTDVNETASTLPANYELEQNYPNPFNPTTNIRYSLVKTSKVTLKIYDILGREVQTLVNTVQAPGKYTVVFNAQGLASGVYFYRIIAGDFVTTKKLMLLK